MGLAAIGLDARLDVRHLKARAVPLRRLSRIARSAIAPHRANNFRGEQLYSMRKIIPC
jgi:hypothetical protein